MSDTTLNPASQEQAAPEGITILRKMNVRAMGCDPTIARQKGNEGKVFPLYAVFGRAMGTKSGENRRDGSVWTALVGRFEAVNLQNNQAFTSGLLFLPKGTQELIEGAVRAAGEDMGVEFALQIAVQSDANSSIGYVYLSKSLKPPTRADELQHLRDLVAKSIVMPVALNPPEIPAEKPKELPAPEQSATETQPAPATQSAAVNQGKGTSQGKPVAGSAKKK